MHTYTAKSSTHPSCSPLPSFLMETVILPPYEEAANRINYAFFQNNVQSVDPDFEGPSLIGRVKLFLEGVVLMIPIVNWVVFMVMQSYSYTLTQQFHAAIEAGEEEKVSFYLNMGFNPNTVSSDGKPPIFKALESGNFKTLHLLLKHGGDSNITNHEGTPFLHALIQNTSYESYDVAKDAIRLYKADATCLDTKGHTILEILYDTNYPQFLLFVNEGLVDPNLPNKHQDTILHHILKGCGQGNDPQDTKVLPAILALVEKGVNLNIRCESNQQTPLWMAYQKLGSMAATAFMRAGADPNERGAEQEIYPGASNIFQVAWDLKNDFPLFWTTALKHGAKKPENFTEGDLYAVCNVVRQLKLNVLKELFYPQDQDKVSDDQLRKKKVELLATMDGNDWETFAQIHKRKDIWGDIWIDLLESGVKPLKDREKENDESIEDLLKAHMPNERKETILLKMQEAGWDVVRIASRNSMDDITFMLLKNGAKPSRSIFQLSLIKKVVVSIHRREIIPIMMENRWDWKGFCDDAVSHKDYENIHFAIEMGMEIPKIDWRIARDVSIYRQLITSIPNVIPVYSGFFGNRMISTEREFLEQLFQNIDQYNAVNKEKINPLEILLFIHSQEGIKRLMGKSSFETFSTLLTDVVTKYPHIHIEWFWKDLLMIPETHFQNYATVKGGRDELPKIPYPLKIDLLLPLFDRINFTDPEKPHYKDENSRRDHKVVCSPESVRSGVETIIRKIKYNQPDAIANEAPDIDAYYKDQEKHLLGVVYYLQLQLDAKGNPIPDPKIRGEFLREALDLKTPLHWVKANVLIDLGRTGKMCSARWKEIMYQCRCRLSGEGETNLNFVDQMRTSWANRRHVIFSGMTVDTHTHDNLMYHLKEARGIRGDKPARLDPYGQYNTLGSKQEAVAAFDRLGYHSHTLIDILWEKGVDFKELMGDWMQDNLAQVANLPCASGGGLRSLRTLARVKGYNDQYLPYTEVEQFFKEYDPDYALALQSCNTEAFLKSMTQEKRLKPLASVFQLPDVSVMAGAFQSLIRAKEQQIDAVWKVFLTDTQQKRYDELKRLKAQAETEWEMAQDVLESSLKEEKHLLEYQNVITRVVGFTPTLKDLEDLEKLIEQYAPQNYKALQERLHKVKVEWNKIHPRVQLNSATPTQLERLQKIFHDPDLKKNQVFFQEGALERELSALKSGNVSLDVMKRAFQDQANHIVVKKDQTLAAFMKTKECEQLRKELGKNFVDRALDLRADETLDDHKELGKNFVDRALDLRADETLDDHKYDIESQKKVDPQQRLISEPQVKRLIAGLYAEVVFSITPRPFSYYLSRFHKDRFTSIMRPQREKGGDVFKRGVNPLVVYQMLVELGELRYKAHHTFQGVFEPLPAPV